MSKVVLGAAARSMAPLDPADPCLHAVLGALEMKGKKGKRRKSASKSNFILFGDVMLLKSTWESQ